MEDSEDDGDPFEPKLEVSLGSRGLYLKKTGPILKWIGGDWSELKTALSDLASKASEGRAGKLLAVFFTGSITILLVTSMNPTKNMTVLAGFVVFLAASIIGTTIVVANNPKTQ